MTNSDKPLDFEALAADTSLEEVIEAWKDALVADATDVASRTKDIDIVIEKDGYQTGWNFAGLQSLGTHGNELTVKIKTPSESDVVRYGAEFELKTNIKSMIRFKRQVKILKDLAKNVFVVTEAHGGFVFIRMGTDIFTKAPYWDEREAFWKSLPLEMYDTHGWIACTQKDLKALGIEWVRHEKNRGDHIYLVSLEDVRVHARDGWSQQLADLTVEELALKQKRAGNYWAMGHRKTLPFPEIYLDGTDSRQKSYENHLQEVKDEEEYQSRIKAEHDEWEAKQKKKAARAPKCPKCGERMVTRSGRYGNFWGCSDYPNCKGTRQRRN